MLGQAGEEAAAALPQVLRLATNTPTGGEDVRRFAIGVLPRISRNPEITLPPILAALNAPMPDRITLRPTAIQALGSVGPEGLSHLISIYKGTNHQEAVGAAHALKLMGSAAAGALGTFIADLNSVPERAGPACEIIETMGPAAAPAVPALRNLLVLPNRSLRVRAASSLIRLGVMDDRIVPVLVETIGERSRRHSPDLEIALRALGELLAKEPGALAAVEERLKINPAAANYLRKNRDYVRIYNINVE